jgi:hypothetical protein
MSDTRIASGNNNVVVVLGPVNKDDDAIIMKPSNAPDTFIMNLKEYNKLFGDHSLEIGHIKIISKS